MKRLAMLGLAIMLAGCSSDKPQPNGDPDHDLVLLNQAASAEVLGLNYQITLPLDTSMDKEGTALQTFANVKKALQTYMASNRPVVENVNVVINTEGLVDSNNQPVTGYLMIFSFPSAALEAFNFTEDFPFQMIIPKASIDYKLPYAWQMVLTWCVEGGAAQMPDVCDGAVPLHLR